MAMHQNRRDWLKIMGAGTAAGAVAATWFEEAASTADATEPESQERVRILYNENPLGCSSRARAAMSAVETQFYGFSATRHLIHRLRLQHELGPLPSMRSMAVRGEDSAGDYTLTLGVGSSELLKALAQACCQQGGSVVEPDPSYRAVGRAARAVSADTEIRRVQLQADGTLDLEAMSKAIDKNTRIVVLTNPNNPTGGHTARTAIEDFIDSVPSQTVVLVDEAYIDFLDESTASAMPLARSRQNVLVTRTFSKLHGLAGLRLGYGVGHSTLIDRLRPYLLGVMGINSAAATAANASLDDKEHQRATREMVKSFVTTMQTELPRFGFKVSSSSAPFVWAEWKQDASPIVGKLAENGVYISGGGRWERPRAVRISAATPDQCERLLHSLRKATIV